MTLGTKLITSFLGCGVIPLGIVGFMSYHTANKGMKSIQATGDAGLEQKAYNQLVALRDVKKQQIERYFRERERDLGVLVETVEALRAEAIDKLAAIRDIKKSEIETFFAERSRDVRTLADNPYTKEAFGALSQAFAEAKAAGGTFGGQLNEKFSAPESYTAVHDQYFGPLKSYMEQYGCCDNVLLMDAERGDVCFTVTKDKDFGQRTAEVDSCLGDVWEQAAAGTVAISDTKPYGPSGGVPAQFVAAPIKDAGQVVGVVALEISPQAVTGIMREQAGMGKWGETYLVGQDFLMRSDSFLDPENHTVAASFKNPDKGKAETEASQAALGGKTGAGVIIDYKGKPVLSAYGPADIGGVTWALLAEIDLAEAFCLHVQGQENDLFTQYKEQYGYCDLFLINRDGYCFYTVAKKSDYQANLVNGKFKDTNLGRLVRTVLNTKQPSFADFEPYPPSDDEPCAFIAQPAVNNGETEVIVALQLPLDNINAMMGVRAGMGETGETYLVGPDKLMRSDSFLDSMSHTVAASFKNPAKGVVDTEAANAALSGQEDAKIISNYSGNRVLSAFTPVEVFGTNWALLAEISEAEAMAEVRQTQETTRSARTTLLARVWSLSAIAAVGVTLVIVFLARSISKPVDRIIAGLDEGADQVNDASAQVSASSQQLAAGASEQASSLEQTSSALEEMAAMTRTNAANAKEANELAGQAREAADEGDKIIGKLNEAMTGINESSGQISKIIKVIEEIAFQTNLLALNAAVEAARAGEHGKGFAVVADEVRNLAQRAAQAARETTGLIEESVNRAREGTQVAGEVGKGLTAIVGDVTKVTALMDGIAQASHEQAQGVDQVNTAVAQMDKVTQQNAAGAEESASASEELAAQSQAVKGMVDELVVLVGGRASRARAAGATATAVAKTKNKSGVKVAHRHHERQAQPSAIPPLSGLNEACEVIPMPDDTGNGKELNEF